MVLKIWSKNRDQVDQRNAAKEIIEIILDKPVDDWVNELVKTDYIKGILQNSVRDSTMMERNKEPLGPLIGTLPDFIGEQQTDVSLTDYVEFMETIRINTVKPVKTEITSTEMVDAMEKLATVFKIVFEKCQPKWLKKIATELEYEVTVDGERKVKKYKEVIIMCFGSLFMTIYFFCTTKDPSFLRLDDYPKKIAPKEGKKASTILKQNNIHDATGMKLALTSAKSPNYAEKVEAWGRAKSILRSQLETASTSITTANGWPEDTEKMHFYAIQTLKTDDSSQFMEILDSIFNNRLKKDDVNSLKLMMIRINRLNQYGIKKNASKLLSLEIFDQIAEYVEKEKFRTSDISNMEPENLRKKDRTADITRKVMGEQSDTIRTILAYPPPLVYENGKPVKYSPKVWNTNIDGPLEEYIHDVFLPEMQTSGVMSRANCIKMIFHILPNRNQRNRFGKLFLEEMEDYLVLKTDEFNKMIDQICREFDQKNVHHTNYYRALLYNSETSKQQIGEDIRSYVDRIINLVKKAHPNQYHEEKSIAVRKIYSGLSNEKTKKFVQEQHTKLLTQGTEPEELLEVILTHQEQERLMNELNNPDLSSNKKGVINRFGEYRQENLQNKFDDDRVKEELSRIILRRRCKNWNLDENGEFETQYHEVPVNIRRSKNFRLADFVGDQEQFRDMRKDAHEDVEEIYRFLQRNKVKEHKLQHLQGNSQLGQEEEESRTDDEEHYYDSRDDDEESEESDTCNLHGVFNLH